LRLRLDPEDSFNESRPGIGRRVDDDEADMFSLSPDGVQILLHVGFGGTEQDTLESARKDFGTYRIRPATVPQVTC